MIQKLFISLFLLLNLGCSNGLFGTDTGNPAQPKPDEPQDCNGNRRCMPTPYVIFTIGALDEKVSLCLGIPQEENRFSEAISRQEGLNVEIPVLEPSLHLLNQSYQRKEININTGSWSNCLKSIHELDCESEIFTSAYDVYNPENLTNIHKLFRADVSCQNVFTRK